MKFRILLTLFIITLSSSSFISSWSELKESSQSVSTTSSTPDIELSKLIQQAEKGDAKSQFQLGIRYDSGEGVVKDQQKSIEWVQKAAEQGYLSAQMRLGSLYSRGEKVPRNEEKASYWFEKAAEQGEPNTQYWTGLRYLNGQGVTQDFKKGFYWIQKSAESGNPIAQTELGSLYENGISTPKNLHKAIHWYLLAAEKNYPQAQERLAILSYLGNGMEKDYEKAFTWGSKAAEKGNAQAQYLLGVMYANGQGTPKDKALAAKWYEKAALQNQVSAQRELGGLYFQPGELNDYKKGLYWYQKAANQGDSKAKQKLSYLTKVISDANILQIENRREHNAFVMDIIKIIQNADEISKPALDQWIEQNATSLESPYLALLAERKLESNSQEALKWYMIAKLGINYDAYRCIDSTAGADKNLYTEILAPKVSQYWITHPSETITAGQAALDWDAKHPSTASPRWVCYHGLGSNEVVPQAQWAAIHQQEREKLQQYLTYLQSQIKIK